MNKLCTVIAAVLIFSYSVFSYAKELKIAVVDIQKIMQKSPQMKQIQEKLEKDFKPRRDQLVAMEEGFRKDIDKLKRDSVVLSATERKDLESKIVSAQQQFERDGRQYQQELSASHSDAMEVLYNKIKAAVSKIAKSDKYDLIIQKDAVPYSSDGLDVTDKVLDLVH